MAPPTTALLDTHAFLWWTNEPSRLSAPALAVCNDPNTRLLLSVVSVWEIQIKVQIGKLTPARPLADVVAEQVSRGVVIVPVLPAHVYALDALPFLHKDPFDRLLITQANVEQAVLLTADSIIPQYPVQTLW